MNRLTLYVIFILSLSLFSCSKQIEGNIVDNFGTPLSNVEISIQNSDFKAISDSKGHFSIDYAAGQIIINFTKDGNYYDLTKKLNISEKQAYPLGEVVLTKFPNESGFFVKTSTAKDYISINNIQLEQNKVRNRADRVSGGHIELLFSDKDSITSIKTNSLENVQIFRFTNTDYILTSPMENGYIGKLYSLGFSLGYSILTTIKEKKTKVANSLQERQFELEYNKVYLYTNIYTSNGIYSSTRYSTNAYVFKFVKE